MDVAVTTAPLPAGVADWVWAEFQELLGPERTPHAADAAALAALSAYPAHLVRQAFDAAYAWLARPKARPIHSLGRWLVGTAQRKQEAEQVRGSRVDATPPTTGYLWDLAEPSADTSPPAATPEISPPTAEQELWQSTLAELALQLPQATFESWLRGTELVAADGSEYTVGLPNAQAKDWVENRLAHTLRRTLASRLGSPVTVRFQVLPSTTE